MKWKEFAAYMSGVTIEDIQKQRDQVLDCKPADMRRMADYIREFMADKKLVVVHNGTEQMETGLKKFGAMLGDYVEVGCNSVLNPGTVIGRHCNVYPTSCVRGVIPENCIFKNSGEVVEKRGE